MSDDPQNLDSWLELGRRAGLSGDDMRAFMSHLPQLAQLLATLMEHSPEDAPNYLACVFKTPDDGNGFELMFRRRTPDARRAVRVWLDLEADDMGDHW